MKRDNRLLVILVLLLAVAGVAAACSRSQPQFPAPPPAPTVAPAETPPPALTAPAGPPPAIRSIAQDHNELPRYEALEMTVDLEATYANPYDAREITLDGVFTAPDGSEWRVPGFWDGENAWRLRFTPSQEGEWRYQVMAQDAHGVSQPAEDAFQVTASDRHGWLQVGSWIDPAYSPRYLAYHDGIPFYGVGHADALNILFDGFNLERGVGLFEDMQAAGENYVVWWPFYAMSPVSSSYDSYSVQNLKVIDTVVRNAEQRGIHLVFTVWDHPQLRDDTHAWGDGRWAAANGFRKLGDIDSFFTGDEAWAWQENLYRYMIARWGYSPAIGLWQTVSEINGTNAYAQTDPWHERVNAYFVENDPYRHPTTASKSGDEDWLAGWQAMDVPQVHLYEFDDGAVASAEVIADWTMDMWNAAEKPNWIGEFGVTDAAQYPELFHNAIWAALGAGAAMTPAEWNSGGSWGRLTPEMKADLARLAAFVADIPLAHWNPQPLSLSSSDRAVRGWGVAGEEGGLLWVQDASLEGQPIAELRADETVRSGVQIAVDGMAAGVYAVRPYDTWQGVYLEPLSLTCTAGQPCLIDLPDFTADIALRLENATCCRGRPAGYGPTPTPTGFDTPPQAAATQPAEAARQLDVSIWAPVAGFLEQQTLLNNADVLDEVNFFWYTLGADGGIEGGVMASQAIAAARQAGLRIVPSIVNGSFDAQRVSLVVNDAARRSQHIQDILALVRDNDYDGIDIDYESLNPADRDAFSQFVEELAVALHAEGKWLSIAVHAKTDDAGAWSGARAQDWARLGAAVDAFKIMTYDYHNGASEAGPIAPLDWVDAVVPPEKTWMGVPVYGYNWTGTRAQSLNWRQALQLAEQQGAQPQRDAASGELTFSYDDGRHTVWFNDGETLAGRLALLREKHPNVAGIAIWPLGGEDPANWAALRAAADN
ncbi:MAG TPA: glycosyl hydrolase family 18 protein [Anaerolineae bacterium]|nr:glycosyl hydrolase family 18 protein [Anaerolineae bacterium]